MANEIYSKNVAVEVNIGYPDTADWKLVTCITSKGLSKTTNSTTINTDCEPDFVRQLPTDSQWSASFDGLVNSIPTADEISADGLHILQDARTVLPIRFRTEDDSYYREGLGFISQLDENGTAGEYFNFSISITGTAPLTYAEAT
jgi:hypothetical protein